MMPIDLTLTRRTLTQRLHTLQRHRRAATYACYGLGLTGAITVLTLWQFGLIAGLVAASVFVAAAAGVFVGVVLFAGGAFSSTGAAVFAGAFAVVFGVVAVVDAVVVFAGAVVGAFAVAVYVEERISLDEHLIRNKEATFFLRVAGNSMRDAGIHDGDLLVVDRSITATPGQVVIAVIDSQFTVKQLVRTVHGVALRAAHPEYADITLEQDQELQIWGVVRWSIHKVVP